MAERHRETRVPQQQRAEQTRRKIMETGQQLIGDDGFYRTSSKKIARAAGVAIGSFYAYFPDKKSLLIELMQEHFLLVRQSTVARIAAEDVETIGSRELIRSIVDAVRDIHRITPSFHRECSLLRRREPDVQRIFDDQRERMIAGLMRVFQDRDLKVRVADLDIAMRVVSHTIEGVLHELPEVAPLGREEQVVAELADMVHRYLFEKAEGGRGPRND